MFLLIFAFFLATLSGVAAEPGTVADFKVLATSKTSTMEKELNQIAREGYRFEGVMGGETSGGGDELVSIVSKVGGRFDYKVLATNKTSTMEKELRAAGASGFCYAGQTIYNSAFGGKEVVVVLERNLDQPNTKYDYKVPATNRTSTMQKELNDSELSEFVFCGVTVAETAFGGQEVVTILRRTIKR